MRGQPRPREHGAIAGWQRHPPGPRRHPPGWWGSRAQPPSAGARTRPRESRCGRMTEAPVRFQQATASPAHGPHGTKRTVPASHETVATFPLGRSPFSGRRAAAGRVPRRTCERVIPGPFGDGDERRGCRRQTVGDDGGWGIGYWAGSSSGDASTTWTWLSPPSALGSDGGSTIDCSLTMETVFGLPLTSCG